MIGITKNEKSAQIAHHLTTQCVGEFGPVYDASQCILCACLKLLAFRDSISITLLGVPLKTVLKLNEW